MSLTPYYPKVITLSVSSDVTSSEEGKRRKRWTRGEKTWTRGACRKSLLPAITRSSHCVVYSNPRPLVPRAQRGAYLTTLSSKTARTEWPQLEERRRGKNGGLRAFLLAYNVRRAYISCVHASRRRRRRSVNNTYVMHQGIRTLHTTNARPSSAKRVCARFELNPHSYEFALERLISAIGYHAEFHLEYFSLPKFPFERGRGIILEASQERFSANFRGP